MNPPSTKLIFGHDFHQRRRETVRRRDPTRAEVHHSSRQRVRVDLPSPFFLAYFSA